MRYILIVSLTLVISLSFFALSFRTRVEKINTLEKLYLRENYSELKKIVTYKLKNDPYNPELYRYLWRAHLYEGHPKLAISVLNQMKMLFQNETDINLGFCFTYYETKETLKALHYCKKLIEAIPHALGVHKKIIDLYLKHGDTNLAIEYINTISEKLDGLERVILLSEAYRISGKIDKEIRLLEKARFKYPKDSITYYLLASAYFEQKKYLKSASFFGEYLDNLEEESHLDYTENNKEDALLKMGKSYEAEQMYRGAKKAYKQLACLYAKRAKQELSIKMIKRTAVLGLMDKRGFVSQRKFLNEFTKIKDYVFKNCGKIEGY